MSVDLGRLREWVGRSETLSERLAPFPATALAATLDLEDPACGEGEPLPPLWHWIYFLPVHRLAESGPDGHARRGGFLPPVPLPRRMWAGGRLTFERPLLIGETVRRSSRVLSVEQKSGRSGALVFVCVAHEFSDARGVALTEEHDIVYREAPAPGARTPAPPPAPAEATWERIIRPDPVLLFRYSALTFNGHRIHYDRRYATEEEAYPGLVVHGPLIATLLLDLVRRERPDARVRAFSFRSLSPLFDTAEFAVCGAPGENEGTVRLWARGTNGALAMEAEAELE